MPKFLYLVRHADAVDMANDAARPLSTTGRQQVVLLAQFLDAQQSFNPDAIWHSPLVRARETAELLKQHLRLTVPLLAYGELEPDANPAEIAEKIAASPDAIALVGHEPHLSALASMLVTGSTHPSAFIVRKGSIIALEPAGRRYQLHWHIHPGMVG